MTNANGTQANGNGDRRFWLWLIRSVSILTPPALLALSYFVRAETRASSADVIEKCDTRYLPLSFMEVYHSDMAHLRELMGLQMEMLGEMRRGMKGHSAPHYEGDDDYH